MSYRKLEILDQEWLFKVGRSYVEIRDPQGRGYRPTIAEVQCETVNFEEITNPLDQRLTEVRPAQVREYILGEIGFDPSRRKKSKKGKK